MTSLQFSSLVPKRSVTGNEANISPGAPDFVMEMRLCRSKSLYLM